jgi:hypothetical protein
LAFGQFILLSQLTAAASAQAGASLFNDLPRHLEVDACNLCACGGSPVSHPRRLAVSRHLPFVQFGGGHHFHLISSRISANNVNDDPAA